MRVYNDRTPIYLAARLHVPPLFSPRGTFGMGFTVYCLLQAPGSAWLKLTRAGHDGLSQLARAGTSLRESTLS